MEAATETQEMTADHDIGTYGSPFRKPSAQHSRHGDSKNNIWICNVL